MTRSSSPSSGSFRLFGVPVRIHVSWILLALLLAWSLAAGMLPAVHEGLPRGAYWGAAVLIVLGLGASIVLHELAHTLVGRAMSVRVDRITLFLFGGVAELSEEPTRPRAELAMAVAGPAFSVVFGLSLAALAGLLEQRPEFAGAQMALDYLATLNLVLAGFNMAPAYPLDGGRVLRALIWMATGDLDRATRIAARAGEGLALLLMGVGGLVLFTQGAAGGLWWILIGLFLHSAARGAIADLDTRRMLAGRPIAELMVRDVETVPDRFTLDRFIDERLLGSRHALYPVEREGRWVGVVAPEDVLAQPRDRWAQTTVGEICRPAAETPAATLLEDAGAVMTRMRSQNTPRMPVVHAGAVVGIVTLQDLLRSLDLSRRFGRTPG